MSRQNWETLHRVGTVNKENSILLPGLKVGQQLSLRGTFWHNGETWVLTYGGEGYPACFFDITE